MVSFTCSKAEFRTTVQQSLVSARKAPLLQLRYGPETECGFVWTVSLSATHVIASQDTAFHATSNEFEVQRRWR